MWDLNGPYPFFCKQMESASGGAPDSEARQALLRLQKSLETLEAAKLGNSTESNEIRAPEGASLPQQMEVLQGRMGHLERRLEAMDPDTQQIVGEAAGEWLHSQISDQEIYGVDRIENVLHNGSDTLREDQNLGENRTSDAG